MPHHTDIPLQQQRAAASARRIFAALPPPTPVCDPDISARAASLYVHVPFCTHKCHYCDFYSIVDNRDRQGAFTARLVRELEAIAPWAGGGPLSTIFVGGGTPSLLLPSLWASILAAMDLCFDMGRIRGGEGEFTVECNPETVTPALLEVLVGGGVNRLSLGAQSFEARHLRTLERHHDPATLPAALEAAAAAGIERTSIDLIYAIPGQTLEEWERDLRRAIELGTGHVSCYNLTYEPNTAMTRRLERGEFAPAEEDLEVEMFCLAGEMLSEAGFDRYEVSNYARPGQACRHNLAYWRQAPWLAAGPSASGHLGGHRWKNAPRLDTYLNHDDGGFAPITDHEPPDPVRAIAERIMTGLRLSEGIAVSGTVESAEAALPGAAGRLRDAADRAVNAGHLIESDDRWRLSEAGWLFADGVAGDLMGAVYADEEG